MYQGPDGQYYDDNGTPLGYIPTDQSQSYPAQAAPPQPAFVSTTPTNGPPPSGIPDPNKPGYDTNGWPLSATPGAPGNVTTPINTTGGASPGTSTTNTGLQTNTPPPAPPPDGGGGGSSSPSTGGGFWPGYQVPSPYIFTPFSYDSYTPLTADQAAAEPGYDFARQQGRDAIQTSQAAKGNILSGAALKDLFAWGDQFASQNYQNAEARNEGIYNINRNNAYNNWAGNTAGSLAAWQANLQPAQFNATLQSGQAGLTLADLFNRFNTAVNSNTAIATAGAR